MKRFLSRFTRAGGDKGHDDPVPIETPAAGETPPLSESDPLDSAAGESGEAPFEFELREPTDEELNASFLSKQDFLDLDRVMAAGIGRMGAAAPAPKAATVIALSPPAPVRPAQSEQTPPVDATVTSPAENEKVEEPAPTSAAPSVTAVAPAVSEPPIEAPAAPARAADKAEAPAPRPAAPVEDVKAKPARPAKPAKAQKPAKVAEASSAEPRALVGFWDGLVVGQSLQGWAGDSHDPACRTVRITLLIDGEEVGSTLADGNRTDTPHGAFTLPFSDPSIAQYIIEDRVVLRATHGDLPPLPLLMLPGILDTARIHRSRELEKTGVQIGSLAPIPRTVSDLSLFRLPVGLESTDGAAITGKEGFLFAHRGPQDVVGHFADRTSPKIETDADAWLTLFRGRQAAIARRKAVYIQSIFPEKATILHALMPPGSPTITARLSLIEANIADQLRADAKAFPYYRSLVAALRSCHAAGIAPYLRLDDGIRAIGAQLCFYQVVNQIGGLVDGHTDQFAKIAALCSQIPPAGRESVPFAGALARHFAFPMYETELVPEYAEIEALLPGPAETEARDDGTVRSTWHNPAAPCDLKILAFGSFGNGANNRSQSWWFKAMFRNFSVIESAEIDLSLINRWRPDVVLCQSLERTLRTLPAR
jgi:hypothetical protein